MSQQLPGRDWPDVEVVEKETRRIRERTKGTLAIILVAGSVVAIICAVVYRAFFGEWGWPTGFFLGLIVGWVFDIVKDYFGSRHGREDRVDMY